jgi:hypothetical protein
MYVAPVAASFRVPSTPARVSPLPALSVPAMTFPLLGVPKLRAQPPLPALHHKAAAATPAASRHATHATPRTVRVPIVSDSHSQAAAPQQTAKAPKDPFANVPVVSDSIGIPLNLPATQAPPAPQAETQSVTTSTTSAAATIIEPAQRHANTATESLFASDEPAPATTAPLPPAVAMTDSGYE